MNNKCFGGQILLHRVHLTRHAYKRSFCTAHQYAIPGSDQFTHGCVLTSQMYIVITLLRKQGSRSISDAAVNALLLAPRHLRVVDLAC